MYLEQCIKKYITPFKKTPMILKSRTIYREKKFLIPKQVEVFPIRHVYLYLFYLFYV